MERPFIGGLGRSEGKYSECCTVFGMVVLRRAVMDEGGEFELLGIAMEE